MLLTVLAHIVTFFTLLALGKFNPNYHALKDYYLDIVGVSAVLHTVSPPWDWKPDFITTGLKEFPRAQNAFYKTFDNRWYRLYVYLVGYAALHARSTVWSKAIGIKGQVATAVAEEQARVANGNGG